MPTSRTRSRSDSSSFGDETSRNSLSISQSWSLPSSVSSSLSNKDNDNVTNEEQVQQISNTFSKLPQDIMEKILFKMAKTTPYEFINFLKVVKTNDSLRKAIAKLSLPPSPYTNGILQNMIHIGDLKIKEIFALDKETPYLDGYASYMSPTKYFSEYDMIVHPGKIGTSNKYKETLRRAFKIDMSYTNTKLLPNVVVDVSVGVNFPDWVQKQKRKGSFQNFPLVGNIFINIGEQCLIKMPFKLSKSDAVSIIPINKFYYTKKQKNYKYIAEDIYFQCSELIRLLILEQKIGQHPPSSKFNGEKFKEIRLAALTKYNLAFTKHRIAFEVLPQRDPQVFVYRENEVPFMKKISSFIEASSHRLIPGDTLKDMSAYRSNGSYYVDTDGRYIRLGLYTDRDMVTAIPQRIAELLKEKGKTTEKVMKIFASSGFGYLIWPNQQNIGEGKVKVIELEDKVVTIWDSEDIMKRKPLKHDTWRLEYSTS